MLSDVLARLQGEAAFICSPELAAAHVRCVARLHAEVPITAVPASAVQRHRDGGEEFAYLPGLDQLLAEAARRGISLVQAGAPWAVTPTDGLF